MRKLIGFSIFFVLLFPVTYTLSPTFADWTLDLNPPGTVISAACTSSCTANSPDNITITCNDGTGSGCGNTYYTTNGSTPNCQTSTGTLYSGLFSVSGTNQTITINAVSCDNAGNTAAVVSQSITFSAAVCTPSCNGGTSYCPGYAYSDGCSGTCTNGTKTCSGGLLCNTSTNVCTAPPPWIQTSGGDVHSNETINTPGGP